MNMACRFLNQNHHVFFDNFFQSHSFIAFISSTNVRLFDCAMYPQRLAPCAKNKLRLPGETVVHQIEKPHVSDLNMKNTGGVDRADQLRSSYTVGRQSQEWYKYIFWFAFNVAACNTYISECEHRPRNHQRTRPQADFLLELGKRLINGYTYRKQPAPSQAP